MATIGSYTKQPAEVVDYDIDFSEYLPVDDFIASAGNPAVPVSASIVATSLTETPALLGIESAYVINGGKTLKQWVTGGTHGVKYKVTVRITSTGGRVKEVEFVVRVKDQ